jgi:hypothetical protein
MDVLLMWHGVSRDLLRLIAARMRWFDFRGKTVAGECTAIGAVPPGS